MTWPARLQTEVSATVQCAMIFIGVRIHVLPGVSMRQAGGCRAFVRPAAIHAVWNAASAASCSKDSGSPSTPAS
jgi:hypothetical protein